MKNKKICSIIALIIIVSMLAACGGQSAPAPTPAPTETAPAQTAEPVETPAPTAAPAASSAPMEVLADGRISVSTVDDFIAAIAPGAHIILNPGTYDLSTAASYGEGVISDYCLWAEVYDGYELIIAGVDDLVIEGSDADTTLIAAVPRYANVLSFEGCKNITVDSLTLGHTEEPGVCSGGVIRLLYANDVVIDDCALYGCGIIGIDANNSDGILVHDTEIYDCSYGAVSFRSCYSVCLDDCDIYSCLGNAVINLSSCDQVGIINCDIYKNNANVMLYSDYSTGVYFGGNKVSSNALLRMFYAGIYPVTVEDCEITKFVGTSWYEPAGTDSAMNYGAVDAEGTTLDDKQFNSMTQHEVIWIPKERTVYVPAEELTVSEDGAIHVSTVDDFLAAIADDTVIYLEPGEYDLSTATGYGGRGNGSYTWVNMFDGPELLIQRVNNLTIMGAGLDKVKIIAQPRYANVLDFEDCKGITLVGFTAGHTEEAPGSCSGAVLNFSGCEDMRIEGCTLYGCGVLGICGVECKSGYVTETEIYDCSYGGVSLIYCSDFSFECCYIHHNGGPAFSLYECKNVSLDGEQINVNGTTN